MAENKSEQPTPKRLRDARKKGEVAKSVDLTQSLVFLTAAGILAFGGSFFIQHLKAFALDSFDAKTLNSGPTDMAALLNRTGRYLLKFFVLSMPLLLGLSLVAIAANFLQVKAMFATEILSPKFEKLNPAAGFKRLFLESRTYIEFAKALVKLSAALWLGYVVLHGMLSQILQSGRLPLAQIGALGSRTTFILLFAMAGIFLLLGAADYFLQRKLYMKKMMMSKDEVRREYKQEEGDPEIRQRRHQIHREILTQNVTERVPKATVLVVNPTHLAVALLYDEATMEAPQISAKGQEQLAEQMIKLAHDHRVPIIRNIPLARSLYLLDVDSQIPEELFNAVAEILNWVYDLSKREAF
jgi:type III secretion YscU/HrpY family protein